MVKPRPLSLKQSIPGPQMLEGENQLSLDVL